MTEHTYVSNLKLQLLTERLAQEFEGKAPGHCVRVDHLLESEARLACQLFRQTAPPGTEGYILATAKTDDALFLRTDQAIEKRNRKKASICLFVSMDAVDAALSSLGNSFSRFPLEHFLRETAHRLREGARSQSPALAQYLREVGKQQYGPTVPTAEQEIAFYTAILGAASWGHSMALKDPSNTAITKG